jgi:hypothetical protein
MLFNQELTKGVHHPPYHTNTIAASLAGSCGQETVNKKKRRYQGASVTFQAFNKIKLLLQVVRSIGSSTCYRSQCIYTQMSGK